MVAVLSGCLGFPKPSDICPIGVMYQQLLLLLFAARLALSQNSFKKNNEALTCRGKCWCVLQAQELLQWRFKDCWSRMNLDTFWKVLGLTQRGLIVKPFGDARLGTSLARCLHGSTKVGFCESRGVCLFIHSFSQHTFLEHLLSSVRAAAP